MSLLKALVASSFITDGAAALGAVGYIESDPLAFTTRKMGELQNADWRLPALPTRADPGSRVVQVDEVLIERRLGVRAPSAAPLVPRVIEPPCVPGWRELATGPIGRRVRAICPDMPAETDQPPGVASKDLALERLVVPRSPHDERLVVPRSPHDRLVSLQEAQKVTHQ